MLLEEILRIFEGERPEKVQVVAIVLGHFEVAVDAVHRLFQKPPSSVQSKNQTISRLAPSGVTSGTNPNGLSP